MPSIREIVKNRLKNEMLSAVKKDVISDDDDMSWIVMLTDPRSLRIISATTRIRDIMDEGVGLVENIELTRQPLPHMEAIYFLTPSVESVNKLIEDYKDAKKPQYGNVHLFFTSHLSDGLFDKIKKATVLKYIKTFKELNLEFLAVEQQCFSLDSSDSMSILFSPDCRPELLNHQHRMANQLVTVCASLSEYPHIRFSRTHTMASAVAQIVQDKLDTFQRANPNVTNNDQRATLLILDRSVDPLSPLLHEYTYQAMCNDIMKIENDRYVHTFKDKKGEEQKKEVLFNDTDPLFTQIRHKHIADVAQLLSKELEDVMAANQAAAKLEKGAKMDVSELTNALKALPTFQEQVARYSLHISVTQSLMGQFKTLNLDDISTLEQNMAMGEDADGKSVEGKKLVDAMDEMLRRPDIQTQDKMRLLMIYIITQEGIKDTDRRKLLKSAELGGDESAAIRNLFYLGVTLSNTNKKSKKKDKKKSAKNEDMSAYTLSRFAPQVKRIAEEFAEGTLSDSEFPYVKEPPLGPQSVAVGMEKPRTQQAQPSWANKKAGKKKDEETAVMVGPRLIIFVVGGMTHSEMRSVYEVTAAFHKEVLIGATSIIKPDQFIGDLKTMKTSEDP